MARKKRHNKKINWRFGLLSLLVLAGLAVLASAAIFGLKKSACFPKLGRVNLVIVGQGDRLAVVTLQKNKLAVISLPEKEKVLVSEGYGFYELGKLYRLDQQEEKNGQLLRHSLSHYLPAALFGYLGDPRFSINDLEAEKEKVLAVKKVFERAFWGKLRTDISRYDLAWLYWQIRGLDESGIDFLAHADAGEGEYFKDNLLQKEGLAIAVFNATSQPGLAAETAVFLERAGARVVQVADTSGEETCRIVASPRVAESKTLFWLAQTFPCPIEWGEEERAEVSLILGLDYWKIRGEK